MLPVDELNTLQAGITITMEDPEMNVETKKRVIKDDIEDFLILVYLMGAEETEKNFRSRNVTYRRDDDKLFDALYKEFAGKTIPQEIDGYVDEGDIDSIKMVADTNMTRMYSTGAYDAGEQFGGGMKRWKTMMDDRVRTTHEFLEGVKVPFEKRFYTFDGDSALYPGGFSNAANNVNCRCEIVITPD